METAPHLVLVGPTGAGKSTIGRRLATRLGLPFDDLDEEIAAAAQRPLARIFDEDGEAGFRALETALLQHCLAGAPRVLATGAGVVLAPANRALLAARACVAWLGARTDTQFARLGGDHDRPLLRGGDRAAVLQAMAEVRQPLYQKVADLHLDTDGLSEEEVLDRLEALLRARWAGATARAGRQVLAVGGDRPYRIHIGPGLLADAAVLASAVRGRHVLVASDAHVAPLYAGQVLHALSQAGECEARLATLPPGESAKSLGGFGTLLDALAVLGATRDACVFALGGGVVGDLAGFAAACWMRGIDVVQLPTSLLAMVDSSVGGKTAIDLPQGKNLVGAFHPPRAVFADTDVLATLPDRELRAGLAEVVKYGAIGDVDFLAWLSAQADALLARDPSALTHAIARSCAHKAAIVERDPYERGERALLNFGHTFAHAIEAEQGYAGGEALNHGEAVAVGMVLAARLSAALGLATLADAAQLDDLLGRCGLPTRLPAGLAPERLLARMRLDKKAAAGGLRFILWRGPGQAEIVAGVDDAAVLRVLAA